MNEWKNIILLSADALRSDHLSCYNYVRETSPELTQLAEESIQFTNAYSPSSHTREAVPALLTGKYPDVAINDSYHLATKTLAERLSGIGFVTGGFHSNPFVSRAYGFDQGFDKFDDDLHLGQHKLIALAQRILDKLRNRHYARAEEINKRALSWVDSLDADQPFFLWAHYLDTHGPYEPPEEYRNLYTNTNISDREAQSLYKRAVNNPDSITKNEQQLLIDLYDAEIRYNDSQIGCFLESLRDRDLLEESILIFTSDHGDAFGEHGYYEHPRYLHEELTHVPLLVRPPNGAKQIFSQPVSTLDIAATVGDSTQMDADFDGVSLFDLSEGDRAVYQQARGEGENGHIRRYGLRSNEEECLCERDMTDDSLMFDDCTVDMREDLKSHIQERIRVEQGHEPSTKEEVEDEIEQRLSALGYRE